jgi:hypothetical protein
VFRLHCLENPIDLIHCTGVAHDDFVLHNWLDAGA